ncbi:MAG: dipeptidase [Desulfitobacterium hafniense]|nr:dipeptidase [Desulfitobacterium hafniense]
MERIWVIDGHCDSIGEYVSGKRNLCNPLEGGHWDIVRAKKGNVGLQFMASYIESEHKPFRSTLRGLELIQGTLKFVRDNMDQLFIVKGKDDLARIPDNERIGLLLSVEGGEILGDGLFMVDIIHHLGVRALGLTWNQRNYLADGVWESSSSSRLTRFGEQVVKRLNDLGMIIDVSHLNEPGFWNVLEKSGYPILASHSCVKAICNHPRNLSDDQLKALARNGGLVGINFYPGFLNESGHATLQDVIQHICYIADLVGIDVLGLGSDFDGIDKTPDMLDDVSNFQTLAEGLLAKGFSRVEIQKVFHGNFMRLLNDVLK